MKTPYKLKTELPHDPAILLLGLYPEKMIIQKDICTPMFIATLFTIARTWKQPICPSIDECKEVVVDISNGILLSHKKSKFESVVVRRMKLKLVTQNEISQEEKNKYSILIHTHI